MKLVDDVHEVYARNPFRWNRDFTVSPIRLSELQFLSPQSGWDMRSQSE